MNSFTNQLTRCGALLVLLLLMGSTAAWAQTQIVYVDPVNGRLDDPDPVGGGGDCDFAGPDRTVFNTEQEELDENQVWRELEAAIDCLENGPTDNDNVVYLVTGQYNDYQNDADNSIFIDGQELTDGTFARIEFRGWTAEYDEDENPEYEDVEEDVPTEARLAADLVIDGSDPGTRFTEVQIGPNLLFTLFGNTVLRLDIDGPGVDGARIQGPGILSFSGTGNAEIRVPETSLPFNAQPGCGLAPGDPDCDGPDGIEIENLLIDKPTGSNVRLVQAGIDPVDRNNQNRATLLITNRLEVEDGDIQADNFVNIYYFLDADNQVSASLPRYDDTFDGDRDNSAGFIIEEGSAIMGDGIFLLQTNAWNAGESFYTEGDGELLMNLHNVDSPQVVGGFHYANVISFPTVGTGDLSQNLGEFDVLAFEGTETIEGGFRGAPRSITGFSETSAINGSLILDNAYIEFLTGVEVQDELLFNDSSVLYLGSDSQFGDADARFGMDNLTDSDDVLSDGDAGLTIIRGDAKIEGDVEGGFDEDLIHDVPAIILTDEHELAFYGDVAVISSPIDLIDTDLEGDANGAFDEDEDDFVKGFTMENCSSEFVYFVGGEDSEDEGSFFPVLGQDDDVDDTEIWINDDLRIERLQIGEDEDLDADDDDGGTIEIEQTMAGAQLTIEEALIIENGLLDLDDDELFVFFGGVVVTVDDQGDFEADDFVGQPTQITYIGDESFSTGDELNNGAEAIIVFLDEGVELTLTSEVEVGTFALLQGQVDLGDYNIVMEEGDSGWATWVQGNGNLEDVGGTPGDDVEEGGHVVWDADNDNHLIYTNTEDRVTTDEEFPDDAIDRVTLRPLTFVDVNGNNVIDDGDDLVLGDDAEDVATVTLNDDKDIDEDLQVWYGTLDLLAHDISVGDDVEINTLERMLYQFNAEICFNLLTLASIGPNYDAEILGSVADDDEEGDKQLDDAVLGGTIRFTGTFGGNHYLLGHVESSDEFIDVPNVVAEGDNLGIILNEGEDNASFGTRGDAALRISQAEGHFIQSSGWVEITDGLHRYIDQRPAPFDDESVPARTSLATELTSCAVTDFPNGFLNRFTAAGRDNFFELIDEGDLPGNAFLRPCTVENLLTSHDPTLFQVINATEVLPTVVDPRFTFEVSGDFWVTEDASYFEDNGFYGRVAGDYRWDAMDDDDVCAEARYGGTWEFTGDELQRVFHCESLDEGGEREEEQLAGFHSLRMNGTGGVIQCASWDADGGAGKQDEAGCTEGANMTVGEDHGETTDDWDVYDVHDYQRFRSEPFTDFNDFLACLINPVFCPQLNEPGTFEQDGELILTLGRIHTGLLTDADGDGPEEGDETGKQDDDEDGQDELGSDDPNRTDTLFVTNDDAAQITEDGQVLFGAIWEGNNLSYVDGNISRDLIERGRYRFPVGSTIENVDGTGSDEIGYYRPIELTSAGQQGQLRQVTVYHNDGVPPGDNGLPVFEPEGNLQLDTKAPMSWVVAFDAVPALAVDVQVQASGLEDVSDQPIFTNITEQTIDDMRIIQRDAWPETDAPWMLAGVYDEDPTEVDGDPDNDNDFVNGVPTFNMEGVRGWEDDLRQTFTIGADSDLAVVPNPVAFAQLIHCGEDLGDVDVYFNNRRIARDVSEGTASGFIGLADAGNRIRVFEAGADTTDDDPLFDTDLMDAGDFTFDDDESAVFIATADTVIIRRNAGQESRNEDEVDVTFVHSDAEGEAIDIRTLDPFMNNEVTSDLFVNNLEYGESSSVTGLDSDQSLNIEITSEDGSEQLAVYNVSLGEFEGGSITFLFCGGELVGFDQFGNPVDLDVVTANEPGAGELPQTFALHGNYPNPFNPSTTISFDLPQTAEVTLEVIDVLGRRVLVLPSAMMEAGANRTLQVEASSLASGTYLYRVVAKMTNDTQILTGRMTLIK